MIASASIMPVPQTPTGSVPPITSGASAPPDTVKWLIAPSSAVIPEDMFIPSSAGPMAQEAA